VASKTVNLQIDSKINFSDLNDRMISAIKLAVDQASDHLSGEAKDVIVSGKHVYTGTLAREVKAERYDKKDEIGFDCFVGTGSKQYGQVIHDQRRHPAAQPPFNAISAWVAKKLGIKKDDPEHFPVVQKNPAKHCQAWHEKYRG
jgi:hypothetical protein